FTPNVYTNLANISLPIPQQYAPLTPVPLNGQRTDTLSIYSTNRVTPYVQNFNFEIQREFAGNMLLSVAYVGSKATKLIGAIPLNVSNINAQVANQTFLDAFNVTRAGGNAALF